MSITRMISRSLLLAILLLWAVSAHSQVVIDQPAEGAVSGIRNRAIIGQAPSGLPVRLDVNGVGVDSSTVHLDGVFEFLGVPLPEGPATITVTVRMRNGKTFNATRNIHTLGSPHDIVPELSASEAPADGATIIKGSARMLDAWGKTFRDGYFVALEADGMTIVAEDRDSTTPGIQLLLKDGVVRFALRAGRQTGPSVLVLSANGLRAERKLYLTTPMQPFMLIGSVSATGSLLTSRGAVGEFSRNEDMSEGLHGDGRIAVTARGTILDRYLLTLSVDSERRHNDQLFRTFDPNLLYSQYGDNGLIVYEAQSNSPVFAKIERDQSHLMYGDFNTGLAQSEFASYNRTFTGGKLHLEASDLHVEAFATMTNRKIVRDEIQGRGTSGYYFLQNGNIVTGSEKVRIEVRDRFHSEVVLSRQEKSRFSDYDIDYTQGSLYFKQPVPGIDEQNNPVYIVVSSEAMSDAANSYVVGGAGEYKPFEMLTLGATGVVEQRSPRNYMLLGGNAGLTFSEAASLKAELAQSSDVEKSGYAWKVEGELNLLNKGLSIRPYYRSVDASFVNANQSQGEVGTIKYGSRVDVQPLVGTTLTGDFYQQERTADAQPTTIRSLSGSVKQALWSGSAMTLKVEDVAYDGPDPDPTRPQLKSHSTLFNGRLDAALLSNVKGNVEYEYNLLRQSDQTRPNALGFGLEYQAFTSVAIYAQHRILDNEGQLTNVGVRTQLGENTSLYGQYEVGRSSSGQQNTASIGLKNSLKITDQLTLNVMLEKAKNLSKNLIETRTPDHDAASASIEYLPAFPLKAAAKGEYQGDDYTTRLSFTYGIDYRFAGGVSLLAQGKFYHEKSRQKQGRNQQENYSFGVAYRPISADWLNLIGRLDITSTDNQIVQPATLYRSTIISSHAIIEPFQGFEIGTKYALKAATDRFDELSVATLTDYMQMRSQCDLTSFMNIGVEGRLLHQHETQDFKFGYSAELGFAVLANTMVVAGYNFRAYAEQGLVDQVYSSQGPYITMKLKFTENLLA